MLQNVRLGSYMTFDDVKEKDILDAMKYLNDSHKMGRFISNIVRIALENPEILCKKDGKYNAGDVLKAIEDVDLPFERSSYINKATKEVEEMKVKVNSIFDMCQRMYTMALAGKKLGLEGKSDNLMMASFILERQIQEIQDTLGIGTLTAFDSNKLDNTHKRADEALEYIINAYDGIVGELQAVVTQPVVHTVQVNEQPKVEVKETTVKNENDEEEFIDFGDADIDSLNNFFGE